jgi:hypothetical protein
MLYELSQGSQLCFIVHCEGGFHDDPTSEAMEVSG